jgi:hypothetical protein
MRVIELGQSQPTLDEVIGQAKDEPLVLRKPDGSMFILSPLDEFDIEAEQLRNNADFLAFLKGLSQEEATISLQELRRQLSL